MDKTHKGLPVNMLSERTRICKICKKELPPSAFDICYRKLGRYEQYYAFYKSYCRPCEVWRVRTSKIARKYGLSLDAFQALYDAQNGKCEICGIALKNGGHKRDRVCIDHDHTTGRVRGLLCFFCNAALGMFEENRESMRRAIDYLDGKL